MESTQQVTGIKVFKPFTHQTLQKASWKGHLLGGEIHYQRKMWGNVTAKKLQAPCFHVLRKGVLKSSTLTTTLSAISTSASASTNFTGRCSTITSNGSGRRNAPLWKQKYQKPTRPPVLLPPTAPTACIVAGPSRQGTNKNFLLEVFLVGEETGRKVTPPYALKRIRTLCREGTNERFFDKEEWLTAQQIASYFSRLATLKNTGKFPEASDINIAHQDLEPLEREIRRYNLRERVKHLLTLWTRFKLQNREPSHAGFSGKGCL